MMKNNLTSDGTKEPSKSKQKTITHARTRPYSRSATKRIAEKKRKEKRRRCAIGREKHIFIAGHAPLDYIGALLKCGRIACQVQY